MGVSASWQWSCSLSWARKRPGPLGFRVRLRSGRSAIFSVGLCRGNFFMYCASVSLLAKVSGTGSGPGWMCPPMNLSCSLHVVSGVDFPGPCIHVFCVALFVHFHCAWPDLLRLRETC
jgi:hypothetical protein